MRSAAGPVRVAIAGCGAVAQLYYAPALQALQNEGLLRVVAAHDPNTAAVARFAAGFPDARRVATFAQLLTIAPQLVIIASPPRHHEAQAVAALREGIDVHCEKPLAPSLAEGERMVAAAMAADRRLSVGLMRRHFPATRTIGRLIAGGALGELESIECFEGGPFQWPVQSPDYFRRAAGSAGVLQDIGSHCLDLLVWWLGAPSGLTYEDDAMGGVEANCLIRLDFGGAPARVRLSRDWAQPNRYVVTGRNGWVGWTVNETNHFDHWIAGAGYAGEVALHTASTTRPGGVTLGDMAPDFGGVFAGQVRALVDRECIDNLVPAVEALPTLALLDRCYAARRPMAMPWMIPGWERDA